MRSVLRRIALVFIVTVALLLATIPLGLHLGFWWFFVAGVLLAVFEDPRPIAGRGRR